MNRVTRAKAKAFSVLELIVALTLSMVLMAAVWSMFNLFTRRELVDRARVDRIQLVRGFHQVLTADLTRLAPQGEVTATPLAIPGDLESKLLRQPSSRKTNQSPRMIGLSENQKIASLRGTNNRLEIRVFETPSTPPSAPDGGSNLAQTSLLEENALRRAFDTVSYEWRGFEVDELELEERTSELEAMSAERTETQGLYRRESSSEGKSSAINDRHELNVTDGFDSRASRHDPEPAPDRDATDEYAPEFVQMRFTYFDGRAWRDSWDSSLAKQFPAAIRVEFDLETNPKKREKLAEEFSGQERSSDLSSAEKRRGEIASIQEEELSEAQFDYSFVVSIEREPLTRADSSTNLPLKRNANRRTEKTR